MRRRGDKTPVWGRWIIIGRLKGRDLSVGKG